MSNGNDTAGTRPVTRDDRRLELMRALRHLEATEVAATTSAHMAVHSGWKREWSGRRGYSWSRRQLLRAEQDLQELLNAAADAMLEVRDLLATYPAAHDDDYQDDVGGAPGYCSCGRWRTSCPARKALERGETMWESEDGKVYPVDGGPEITWLPAL